MSAALKLFVEDARAITIADAAQRLNLKCNPRGSEHPQPCSRLRRQGYIRIQHPEEQMELPPRRYRRE